MRNNAKRLLSLMLAVLLVFSLSLTAFAAEELKSLLVLRNASEDVVRGGKVTIQVDTTTDGVVADGKLTVSYPAASLRFLEAKAGSAWSEKADLSLQVNDGQAGTVVLAFAGVDAAKAGTAFTLTFEALEETKSTVSLQAKDSYITGADGYSLNAGTEVDVTCPAAKFTDVDRNRYYHEGIDYVLNNGYMIGVTDTLFAPEAKTDRAMMVTILYRMAGSPKVTGTMPFTDVKEGRYFYDAVLWASQNDIAKGVTSTRFAPTMSMTREQMVTFLYRYAKLQKVDTTSQGSLKNFTDAGEVSAYALEAMTWAVGADVIQGVENNRLSPKGTSTRGQIATVVERFDAAFWN